MFCSNLTFNEVGKHLIVKEPTTDNGSDIFSIESSVRFHFN